MTFKGPARRRIKLELHHVEAFIPKAVAMDRLSTAIQFETMMRQKDVIGEWEPLGDTQLALGIVLNGHRWMNRLTWTVPRSMVISKDTTKTAATVIAES
jgi:hypothetical protein